MSEGLSVHSCVCAHACASARANAQVGGSVGACACVRTPTQTNVRVRT